MKKKILMLLSCSCFAASSCLSVNPNALFSQGERIACERLTSGLPGANYPGPSYVEYCGSEQTIDPVFDFNLSIN